MHARRGIGTAIVLAAGAVTIGAAVSSSAASPDSGVRGRVLYGPTCPVQRVGQACTRPFQATITVRREPGERFLASIRSSSGGHFTLRLSPGRYRLVPKNGDPFPRGSPVAVVVRAHRYASVTINYDSGIR
jgi:hypothetical protein